MVTIIVNGEQTQLEAGTLEDVIRHYKLLNNPVMAELDGLVIGREQWPTTPLRDGMKLELLHIVGGG